MGNTNRWERELREVAKMNDCEIKRTGSGHYRLTKEQLKGCVIASATPKNQVSAMMLVKQDIRRTFGYA